MKKFVLALAMLLLAQPLLAQASVHIVGHPDKSAANSYIENQALVTPDGKLLAAPGPSSDAGAATLPASSSAVSSGQVIKASAGNLYSFNVTSGASAGFIMIVNSTTVPSAGAITPVKCYAIAASSSFDRTFPMPISFSTGIVILFSTTGCFSYTVSATAFISGDAK
jgi:hypothetical protein